MQASSSGSLDIWTEATIHYRRVAEYLQHCFDSQFQYVLCARRVWSYSNGRYFGDDSGMFDVFVPYSQAQAFEHIASANLFETEFNSFEEVGYDWKRLDNGDIRMETGEIITAEEIRSGEKEHPLPSYFDTLKTPAHDIIFNTQLFDREVQKHYWTQFGRLLYPVGHLGMCPRAQFRAERYVKNLVVSL